LAGCAGKEATRPYFSREKGAYITYKADRIPDLKKGAAAKVPPSDLKRITDSYLGAPYLWGGDNRSGMDCSGFIKRVFVEAYGLKLPHNSGKIGRLGKSVSRAKLRTGDIVLFGSIFGIHHAGIYMGEDNFIHASVSKGVMYSKLSEAYYRKRYKGARRIVP
jgi:lipoprotein Spr